MDREFRVWSRPVELRADGDGRPVLSGYGALFNVFSANLGGFVEEVAPGAFTETISRGNNIALLGNHDPSWLLATTGSETLTLTEDNLGLRYEAPLNTADPDAQRMAEKVRARLMPGSSFSFNVIDEEWSETDAGFPLRRLLKVRLWDVGPVTFPAYPDTANEGVAVALRSLADARSVPFESLRDAHAAGDVRTALKSSDPVGTPEPTTSRLSVARARLALAERGFPAA